MLRTVLLAAVFALSSASAVAETRPWTTRDGRFSVQAELLKLDGKTVTLKKTNGQTVTVAIEILSDADRMFLAESTPPAAAPVAGVNDKPILKPLASLEGHQFAIWCVAVSPNGRVLATGGGNFDSKNSTTRGELILWNPATRARIARLPSQGGRVRALAFSPDGNLLAAAYEEELTRHAAHAVLWSVADRRPQHSINFAALSLAFSRDGTQLAMGGWEMTNLAVPKGRGAGTFASFGAIRVWDVQRGRQATSLENPKPAGPLRWRPGHFVESIAFSPNGKMIAAGSHDGTVRLWDVAARNPLATPQDGKNAAAVVAFSPDTQTLAFGTEDQSGQVQVALWDIQSGKVTKNLPVNQHVHSLAFSHNGKTLAAGTGWVGPGETLLWDSVTGERKASFSGHDEPVMAVAFTPDDKTLVTGDGKKVMLWDVSAIATMRPAEP